MGQTPHRSVLLTGSRGGARNPLPLAQLGWLPNSGRYLTLSRAQEQRVALGRERMLLLVVLNLQMVCQKPRVLCMLPARHSSTVESHGWDNGYCTRDQVILNQGQWWTDWQGMAGECDEDPKDEQS